MKIKVIKSTNMAWYSNQIDTIHYVVYNQNLTNFITNGDKIFLKEYVVITELPESFCVNKCDDKDKFNKYINWLNKNYGSVFQFSIWKYYGVNSLHPYTGDTSFGTEIHIDDMIKHIEYMENKEEEFDFNRKDAGILFPEISIEVAYNLLKCLATGTDEDLHEFIKISPSSEISKLESDKSYDEGIIGIKNRFNNYINMKQEFYLTTDEGRLAYAKEHYPIGTRYTPLDEDGKPYSTSYFSDYEARIWVDGTNFSIEVGYGLIYTCGKWAEIIKEEINMEKQKLSRKGLKEIHSVACPTWKKTLEQMGSRNTFEDYIELKQFEVEEMFKACTKEQLPIVSKYLKQDDGSVDTSNIRFDKSGATLNDMFILRTGDADDDRKSFWLNKDYEWSIIYSGSRPRLKLTKKK